MKPNPLSLTQSENYSFGAHWTKFQAMIKNLPIKIFRILGISKPPYTNLYGK